MVKSKPGNVNSLHNIPISIAVQIACFDILPKNYYDYFVEYYPGSILVARFDIKVEFLLVYTTVIHTHNKILNPLKLVQSSEGASFRLFIVSLSLCAS